jgi:tellurite resistance-related uncharacterized protein
MRTLPANAAPYRRTPEFTDSSVPQALLRCHSTRPGAWGKIVVLDGMLTYRILEPTVEEVLLSPQRCGVIEPTVTHEVVPHTGVRFYVEFYRVEDSQRA